MFWSTIADSLRPTGPNYRSCASGAPGSAITSFGATVVTTNTIPLRAEAQAGLGSLKVLSVASLIAEAIRRIHNEESVSSLFT